MESNDENLGWLTEEEIKVLSTEESEKYKEWAIKRLNDFFKTGNELDRNLKNLRELREINEGSNEHKGRYMQRLKELNEEVLAMTNKLNREYKYTEIQSSSKGSLSQKDIDALLGQSSDE
ncbi:MAG: hypothetical protein IPL26_21105 [Leptospiraceae bacterium]|nr:hypothetical protein [Leptospiraceae bacterium]